MNRWPLYSLPGRSIPQAQWIGFITLVSPCQSHVWFTLVWRADFKYFIAFCNLAVCLANRPALRQAGAHLASDMDHKHPVDGAHLFPRREIQQVRQPRLSLRRCHLVRSAGPMLRLRDTTHPVGSGQCRGQPQLPHCRPPAWGVRAAFGLCVGSVCCRWVGLASACASHPDEERGTERSVQAGPGQSVPGRQQRNLAKTQKQLGNVPWDQRVPEGSPGAVPSGRRLSPAGAFRLVRKIKFCVLPQKE